MHLSPALTYGYPLQHKPHVPWYAPARFWDLYPLEKVPPTPHPGLVTGNVAVAMQDWQALGFCHQPDMNQICEPLSKAYPLDNTTFPLAARQYARQAYFASVSWTDANIGRVLDAFEKTKFANGNDYVLAVWGDHVSCRYLAERAIGAVRRAAFFK
jgi:iduronate 2-sulfatase